MKESMKPVKKAAPIKVKQNMIDFIKTQGMAAALKRAGSISAKGTKGEAEFLEGVKRMYGANRLAAATKAAAPKATAKKAPVGRIVDMGKTTPKVPGKGPAANMAKSSASPKPTAQQMAQAKARAGGNSKIASTPKPKSVETPAQKIAKAQLKKKQSQAAAAAVKRAGGRTL